MADQLIAPVISPAADPVRGGPPCGRRPSSAEVDMSSPSDALYITAGRSRRTDDHRVRHGDVSCMFAGAPPK
jgi:hypothetical protein